MPRILLVGLEDAFIDQQSCLITLQPRVILLQSRVVAGQVWVNSEGEDLLHGDPPRMPRPAPQPDPGVPYDLMLRALRSPRFAGLTLAAFLIAQPIVGCALLCLVDNHHGLHEMAGMTQPSATGAAACHTGIGTAAPHGPAQTLSVMEPAGEAALGYPATVSIQVPDPRLAAAPQIAPSLDPPPPRIV